MNNIERDSAIIDEILEEEGVIKQYEKSIKKIKSDKSTLSDGTILDKKPRIKRYIDAIIKIREKIEHLEKELGSYKSKQRLALFRVFNESSAAVTTDLRTAQKVASHMYSKGSKKKTKKTKGKRKK